MSDAYDEILGQQDWAALSRRLTRYAYTALGRSSWKAAEDLAQTVLTRLFDPKRRAWDPDAEPELFAFLARDLRDHVLANLRQRRSFRAELPYDHTSLERLDHGEDEQDPLRRGPRATTSSFASPAEIIEREERRAVLHAALVEGLAGDVLALGVVKLAEDGVDGREEQAAALGCTVAKVKAARERIGARLAKIQREEERHGVA